MELSIEREHELKKMCVRFRAEDLAAIYKAQSGHPGGSLSACEIITLLYQYRMNVKTPDDPNRDRFVLCKGHGVPMLYCNLIEKGFLPRETLKELRMVNSPLQGHPSIHTPGIDMPSGPLGIGLAAAQGMALGLRMNHSPARVYALLGDGELDEGAVWEAVASAAHFKLSNLCAIVDLNKVQLDGTTDEVLPLLDVEAKWKDFGWHVIRCDGHDLRALNKAFDAAEAYAEGPTVIIADTVKGKGISFMEGQAGWHGKAIDSESFNQATKELKLAMEKLGGEL